MKTNIDKDFKFAVVGGGLSNFEDIAPFRNFVDQTGYEYLTAIGYDVSSR